MNQTCNAPKDAGNPIQWASCLDTFGALLRFGARL